MPGYKVFLEDGGEIREGLTCAYCKLVLKDPVQTSESGLRLCRGCFEKANRDAAYVDELDPDDKIWPDSAVKREITNLRVKCENYNVGCDWKGLFKQLMQHSQECQYVTVECSNTGCGQQVVKAKMEAHLKEECQYRRAKCKDCGKKMCFIELQDHLVMCPNAPRKCEYCAITVPEHKFGDHIIECERIGSESTKMLEAFKEMAKVYQQATKRIDVLENYRQEDAQRIKMLENYRQEDAQRIKMLENYHQEDAQRIKMLENCRQEDAQRIKTLENYHQEDIQKIKTLERKDELLEMQAIRNESKIQALEDETISNEHLCNKSLSSVS